MSEERRLVTVLFADVTGSTALGETLDPEDLRALLTRYYAIAKDVVAAHGGTVEKFIGDAVMAVFGLPPRARRRRRARPLRGARAARPRPRAIRASATACRSASASTAATSSPAATRAGDDFLVTGDAVNVAARLQQNADAVVDPRRRADRPRGAVASSASGRPSRSRRRARARRPVSDAARAAPTRSRRPHCRSFGRDADLPSWSSSPAARSTSGGRSWSASSRRPARARRGCSRRSWTACRRSRPSTRRDRPVPALRPAPDLLAAAGRAAPPRRPRRRRAAGRVRGGRRRPGSRDRDVEDAPAVGRAARSRPSARRISRSVDRAALFAAWRTFVEAAAADAPLSLVLEDLHWSSDSLLDLFDFARPAARRPADR